MKNGFIMAKAKEQTMAEMYDGRNIYLALTLGAAVTGIAAAGLGSAVAAAVIPVYLLAGGTSWRQAYLMRQEAYGGNTSAGGSFVSLTKMRTDFPGYSGRSAALLLGKALSEMGGDGR